MDGAITYPQDKHIVVIGCGYGGKELCVELLKQKANFTVIDNKDFFYHNVAAVRTFVDSSYASKMLIQYKPTFGAHFHQGRVTSIDTTGKTVTVSGASDGTVIPYDTLVIATGSTGPLKEWLLSHEEMIKKYTKYTTEVKNSKNILVVGGGPVGVEIAAEIRTDFPDKTVTIVHSHNELVSPLTPPAPKEFYDSMKAILEEMKVNVIYGETVKFAAELPDCVRGLYKVLTDKGRVLESIDLVIKCTGLKVNSSAYTDSLSSVMNANGALKVDECLRVQGLKDVFAIGDCNDLPVMKLAYVANLQAAHTAKNLLNLFSGEPLQPFTKDIIQFLIGVSLGRNHAACCLANGAVLPEQVLIDMKCRDMMLGRFYSEMNQELKE